MICPCCKSKKFIDISLREDEIENQSFKYVKCIDCNIIVSNPIPSNNLLTKVYSDFFNYDWYKKVAIFKKMQARKRFWMLKKYFSISTKHLDVGSNYGYFVNLLRDDEIDSYGYDISLTKEQEKSPYFYNNLESVEMTFDVITMFHSLEHIPDITSFIKKIKKLLNKDGILIIFVPNYQSIGQKIKQKDWVWLQQPYIHIWQFSKKNIELFLQRNGFSVIRIWTKDTWDANIYDYTFLSKLSSMIDRLSFKKIDRVYIESIVRIFTLVPSSLLNITFFKYFLYGSELIVVVKND